MKELLCKRQKSLFSFLFFLDMRKTHIMRHVEINWHFFTNIDIWAECPLLFVSYSDQAVHCSHIKSWKSFCSCYWLFHPSLRQAKMPKKGFLAERSTWELFGEGREKKKSRRGTDCHRLGFHKTLLTWQVQTFCHDGNYYLVWRCSFLQNGRSLLTVEE